ncbi:MAG TPA: plasmid replication initiator TrfA [Candidatus Competibacteraceae bacterium]|nr:plasmid replication initiator TrfA [Candidatus Competibacteraceae bacterium]
MSQTTPPTTESLVAQVEGIAARAKQQRFQKSPPPAEIHIPDQVVKLPVWSEAVRACPSCVLRSALFGVVRRGRRQALKRQIIATWARTVIRYTGWRLDQADLDIWLTALHITREFGFCTRIQITISEMLKIMGRKTDGRSYEWFNNAIARLTACAVEITVDRKTYGGSLIESFERDEDTGDYVLHLNPKLAVLFEDDAFTRIHLEQRQGLRMDLAKWLHGYILSHQATVKNPHRISLGRLRELCGSETSELWKFRQQVREAMDELLNAGVVARWSISANDALEVIRPTRNAQILEGKQE